MERSCAYDGEGTHNGGAMITLLIKGDEKAAMVALEKRNLCPILMEPHLGLITVEPYTKVRIIETAENQHKVATWYCEEGEAPFPLGALLHYSYLLAEEVKDA